MTPEREVLRAMRNSIASWVKALDATPNKDRELKHLLVQMRSGILVLDQFLTLARTDEPEA